MFEPQIPLNSEKEELQILKSWGSVNDYAQPCDFESPSTFRQKKNYLVMAIEIKFIKKISHACIFSIYCLLCRILAMNPFLFPSVNLC